MSVNDLFADDSYDVTLMVEDDEYDLVGEDFDEDHIKGLLFPDNDEEEIKSKSSKESPKNGKSSRNADVTLNETSKSKKSAIVSPQTSVKRKTSYKEKRKNEAVNNSNLITLTLSDDNDEQRSPRIYSVEDEDDDEDDNERHTKFKSERTIKTASKKRDLRDIPDSLECVVIKDENSSNSHKGIKRKMNDFSSNQLQKNHRDSEIRPRIHVNPHFRGPSKPSLLGPPVHPPPLFMNEPSIPLSQPRHISPQHQQTSSMLNIPLNDFHPNFIDTINTYPNQNHFPSPKKQNNHQQFNEHGFWSPPSNEVLWDNSGHYPQLNSHQLNPTFNSNTNFNNDLRRNPHNYTDMYINNNSFTQSNATPIQLPHNTNLHTQTPGPMFRHNIPRQQMNTFLPHNSQQRFPLRNELPQFSRPEMRPFSKIPQSLPQVERFQTPLFSGITRALLPCPPMHRMPHTMNTHNPLQNSSTRPLISKQPIQRPSTSQHNPNLTLNTLRKNMNPEFGMLKPMNAANNLRQPVLIRSAMINNPINKTLSNKYTGIKTIINRNENNDSRKIALFKTKQAKKFLQKRPVNILKPVKTNETNNTVITLDTAQEKKTNNSTKLNASGGTKSSPVASTSNVKQIELIDIDEEYKRKLEEQKRLRENLLKKKEERRREMIQEKSKQSTNELKSDLTKPTTQTTRQRQVIDLTNIKSNTVITLAPTNVDNENGKRIVNIKGLALTTTQASIRKLCSTIGPTKSITLNTSVQERTATVIFEYAKDALRFQNRYQRYLLDLCVIQITLS